MSQPRYLVQIQFIPECRYSLVKLWDICEPVKSIFEARSYRNLIDGTVNKAQVSDMLTDKVVEVWK